MSTYKGIKGFKVQSFSADPVPTVAGWSSSGALNTARRSLASANAAAQDASLGFGGATGPTSNQSLTEEYNGTSWTASGALGTARGKLAGAGTQTAG